METVLEKATVARPSSSRANINAALILFRMRSHSVAYGTASRNALGNATGYAKVYSRSHDAVIRVYHSAGNVIETHEYVGDFNEV